MNFFFSDLDGTLEDSRTDMTNAVVTVRAHLQLPFWEASKITPNVNRGMAELYRACFSDYLADHSTKIPNSVEKLEQVRELYEDEYLAHVADHTCLYEGMDAALRYLATQGKIIVITNKPEKISRALLEKLGVGTLITDVMGGDSCSENKPSPLPLRIAAERHGFDRSVDAAFMIGDTLADIRAGKAFGAKTVWCSWGYLDDPGAETPDFRFDHPAKLPHLLHLV